VLPLHQRLQMLMARHNCSASDARRMMWAKDRRGSSTSTGLDAEAEKENINAQLLPADLDGQSACVQLCCVSTLLDDTVLLRVAARRARRSALRRFAIAQCSYAHPGSVSESLDLGASSHTMPRSERSLTRQRNLYCNVPPFASTHPSFQRRGPDRPQV
jgi:hypothetical protein